MAYYKVSASCPLCGKSHPNRAECPLVTNKNRANSRLIEKRMSKNENFNAEVEEKTEQDKWGWTLVKREPRRQSDADSVVSESAASTKSSQCWSVSTAATLTQPLTKAEEMEARNLEAQLRKISLQERKSEGQKPLTEKEAKLEEAETRRLKMQKTEINLAPVMIKVNNGAPRWTLDTVPLSMKEEEKVRSAEARLRALKRLQDRKASGEWLQWWEMEELNRKQAIESSIASSLLMKRVREGAPRCALAGEQRREPLAAPAALAPAPAPAAVPIASPAPSPACAPVPSAEVPAKAQEPTLSHIVAVIREQLELEDSLSMGQVIAKANLQLGLPATGTTKQQALCLFHQLA